MIQRRLNFFLMWFYIFSGFAAVCMTLTFGMTEIPGLHFDEAWQGLFADRILKEPGFWPLEAMNSYTSPVTHYLLALVFKLFGTSLLSMRAFFAVLNLLSGIFIFTALYKRFSLAAGFYFLLLFALLPICVHDHRFYIEVTGWHAFCFSVIVLSSLYFKKYPGRAGALISVFYVLGLLSHISFVAFLLAAAGLALLDKKNESLLKLLALNCMFSSLIAYRMGIGLHKTLPFVLSALLLCLGLVFFNRKLTGKLKGITADFICKYSRQTFRTIGIALVLAFIICQADGLWSYSQATGHVPDFWIPLNALLFICVLVISMKKRAATAEFKFLQFSLLFTTLIVFKPSPRFFLVHTLLLIICTAAGLSVYPARYKKRKILLNALFISTILWNVFAFKKHYLEAFRSFPPTDETFKIGFPVISIKDSGRDFRPFQKAYAWAIRHDCQYSLTWVEDDRFLRPVEFLRNEAPKVQGVCPWSGDDLFFHHIPHYSKMDRDEKRTAENTPPPYPHVKLLAHSKDWGDLAYWVRIKN